MTVSPHTGDLRGAQFVDADLRGARFVRSDLRGAVFRGADVDDVDLDAPWLTSGGALLVNGVDVAGFVDAELDRRFPGRGQRRAGDPDGLRAAWAAVERSWTATIERAESLPPTAVESRVDGEWSFAETLRHLVMATDTWLGKAILGLPQPYHRVGLPNAEAASDGFDFSVLTTENPSYDEVLEARAGRMAMVRDYMAGATADVLAAERRNPWAPDHPETVLSCLHVILNEEWEHHRYAVRDLATLAART